MLIWPVTHNCCKPKNNNKVINSSASERVKDIGVRIEMRNIADHESHDRSNSILMEQVTEGILNGTRGFSKILLRETINL